MVRRVLIRHLLDGVERAVLAERDASVSIGSAPEQAIMLPGPGVLAEHALLAWAGHHTVLTALAGALVHCDGLDIEPGATVLIDGREFVIGDHALRVTS